MIGTFLHLPRHNGAVQYSSWVSEPHLGTGGALLTGMHFPRHRKKHEPGVHFSSFMQVVWHELVACNRNNIRENLR